MHGLKDLTGRIRFRSIGGQGHDGDIATASYCEGCGHREGCLGQFMIEFSSCFSIIN